MTAAAPLPTRRRKAAMRLTQLALGEVSCVGLPANPGARHLLFKGLSVITKSEASAVDPPAGDPPASDPPDTDTAKGAEEETTAALTARCADLQRRLAERDQELAWMADRMAALAAAAEAQATTQGTTPEATSATKAAPPPDPAAVAYAQQDARLGGLAIVAKSGRHPGSRGTWHAALVELGQHLAPDLPPPAQIHKALQDPRGHAFLRAKTECAT